MARQMRVKPHTVKEWLTKALCLPCVGEELGLTPQQMDELRNRFARLKGKRFTTGGGQMVHRVNVVNLWTYPARRLS
jgi:hypothetical protein